MRRNSNAINSRKQDKSALKAEVEKLLKSAGLECAFNNPPSAEPTRTVSNFGGNEYYEKS